MKRYLLQIIKFYLSIEYYFEAWGQFLYQSLILRLDYRKRVSVKFKYSNQDSRFPIALQRSQHCEYLCILALYVVDISESTYQLLLFLNKCGFAVHVVNNRKLSADSFNKIRDLVARYTERINIGRDIGAFRDYFLMLMDEGSLVSIKALAMVNDSFQFIPGNFLRVFSDDIMDFLSSANSALFTHCSYTPVFHYQSFFTIIKSSVFHSRPFIDFWKKYKVVDHRYHSINHGEIRVSQEIYNKLDKVVVLYTPLRLLSSCFTSFALDRNSNSLEAPFPLLRTHDSNIDSEYHRMVVQIASLLPVNHIRTLLSLTQGLDISQSIHSDVREVYIQALCSLLESSNQSHTAAFIYPFFLGCPIIKIDLCAAGTFPISYALDMHSRLLSHPLNGLDQLTIKKLSEELSNRLISKGTPGSIRRVSLRTAYRTGVL